MPTAEAIQDLREETRSNLRNVKNHCPFGCALEDLDEHGYCHHLVGFANGVKVGDPIDEIVVNPETGVKHTNGRHKRDPGLGVPPSKQVILKGDEIVNPEETQFVNGVMNVCKKWVSSRVYRDKPEPKKA